jgi:hypothetical protein
MRSLAGAEPGMRSEVGGRRYLSFRCRGCQRTWCGSPQGLSGSKAQPCFGLMQLQCGLLLRLFLLLECRFHCQLQLMAQKWICWAEPFVSVLAREHEPPNGLKQGSCI